MIIFIRNAAHFFILTSLQFHLYLYGTEGSPLVLKQDITSPNLTHISRFFFLTRVVVAALVLRHLDVPRPRRRVRGRDVEAGHMAAVTGVDVDCTNKRLCY